MKLLLALLPLALVPHAARSTALAFDPEEGTTLTRTFVAEGEYTLDSITFAVDGEEVGEVEDPEYELESLERIVVTDELSEVDEGRPTDLERTFVELLQEGTETSAENERSTTSASALEGRTVRFLWDDDDEDWYAEASDEGDAIDENVLAWLAGDMDFLAFLPADEVEEGDEWELEAEAYLVLMWPGGLFDFVDEDQDGVDPISRSINEQMIENLSGEGTATLESVDGSTATIAVELDIESWAEAEIEIEDLPATLELETERTITGELYWNLDENRLASASLEADSERVRRRLWNAETEDGEVELSEEMTFSGTVAYEVEFELE